MNMRKGILGIFFIVWGVLAMAIPQGSAQSWQEEFDRLCGYADEADSLSTDELRKVLADCDSLLQASSGLNAPENKVYLFRLKKCRNFYQYILDQRDRNGP